MRFGVLGPLTVWTSDGRPVRVPEVKVRALLADLLAHQGRPVPADRLIEDLWGEALPANPPGVLHSKVSQLRRVLEAAEPGGRDLVVSLPAGYLLRSEGDTVDAQRFQSLIALAHETDDLSARASLLADALALWRGAPYADFADHSFAIPVIGRLEEERLAALETQCEARLELGEHSLLVGELSDLVQRHPLRERLRATQMRALYQSGRQSEALAAYRDLHWRLADELGVAPGPGLAALHQSILNQRPELEARPAPATSVARPRTNLPGSLTALIGRQEAVGQVRSLLAERRLVTLTGPGGVGKTRLAVEAAGGLLESFSGGVWLVELAGRGGSEAADATSWTAEAVMAALGIRDGAVPSPLPAGGPATPADRLVSTLRSEETLLVLDNCEHLLDPVAELAERLLRAAPGLRVLATSQESLGLRGETLWAVPPLDLPAPGTRPDPARLQGFSAVQLFVERASARSASFALDADNARSVEVICRSLDGIPLALELAATRVGTLGAHELAARLDDRFRLLAHGHRGAPPRQQTLRAMIDWSWELLSGSEQIVLRRLAAHVEGCTLEAAEAVCAGDGVRAGEVPHLLARLADRSLVVPAGDPNRPRYRLLESVAAYCAERLRDSGESEAVRLAHRRYYTELAHSAERQLYGHAQRQWLTRLDAESANLRSAFDSCMRHADWERALRLVNSLAWYWFLRGRLTEAKRSLTAALECAAEFRGGDGQRVLWVRALAWRAGITVLAGEAADPQALTDEVLALYDGRAAADDAQGRARAEWFLGFAMWGIGDLTASERHVKRALADFRVRRDRWGMAAALSTRAMQATARGDLDALRRNGEESLMIFHELGDRWGQLNATSQLAALAEITGEYARSTRLSREGLRIAEDLGLWTEVSHQLAMLGRSALLVGDYATAEELHERARKLAREQSHRPAEMFAEVGLAIGARRQGGLDTAEKHLRNWLDWCRRLEGEPGVAFLLAELGFIAELRGDAEQATALHQDGFAAARATGDPRALALALEGLAGARVLTGRPEQAARLLGAAGAARAAVGAPLPEAEQGDIVRITTAVSGALDAAAFAAATAAGAALSPLEYASHAAYGDDVAQPSCRRGREAGRGEYVRDAGGCP